MLHVCHDLFAKSVSSPVLFCFYLSTSATLLVFFMDTLKMSIKTGGWKRTDFCRATEGEAWTDGWDFDTLYLLTMTTVVTKQSF